MAQFTIEESKSVKAMFTKICKEYGLDRGQELTKIQNEFNKKYTIDGVLIPKNFGNRFKSDSEFFKEENIVENQGEDKLQF